MNENGVRKTHFAGLIRGDGQAVSPICSDRPKPLNMVTETWTLNHSDVTCKKCQRRMRRSANRVTTDA